MLIFIVIQNHGHSLPLQVGQVAHPTQQIELILVRPILVPAANRLPPDRIDRQEGIRLGEEHIESLTALLAMLSNFGIKSIGSGQWRISFAGDWPDVFQGLLKGFSSNGYIIISLQPYPKTVIQVEKAR